MKNLLSIPVIMIFIGVFIAFTMTYGEAAAGEIVMLGELVAALFCFVTFPVVGLLLVTKERRALGNTISLLSPLVGLATFLIISV